LHCKAISVVGMVFLSTICDGADNDSLHIV
jgi:hypothetical protein